MEIKNFTPRLYQETILDSCSKKNTLVVLPTGLGKTKLAILVAVKRANQFPSTKILFLTPTKPLAAQIKKEFQSCTDVLPEEIVLFTGELEPEKRAVMIGKAKVIISTPQTVSNDVVNGRINLEDFSLLVLDEAHRCMKDYAYTWLCKNYMKKARYPRIIGLTASPGADTKTITDLCKNAFIEEIEIRTDQDPDVKPYVQELRVEWIKVDLPGEFKEVQNFLHLAYKEKIGAVKSFGIVNKSEFSKKELLSLMASLQGRLARGERDFQVMRAISLLAEVLKIEHAIELLETQGAEAMHTYVEKLFYEAEKTKVKAVKNLAKDLNMRSALVQVKHLLEKKIEHPKLTALKKVVGEEIKKNPNLKIIVFNQYRESGRMIEGELNKIEGVKAKVFVGQAKETGLSQKEQLVLIEEFSGNLMNCIVSTSIGEEGLDIPKVDLVIFFEPIPSAIRSIQRRGRTARNEKGRVLMLMTKNTRDEAYHWVAFHKERNMYRVLDELKKKLTLPALESQPTLADYTTIEEPLKVYADSREANSIVIKELVNQGIKVTTKVLDVADYIISDKVAIERKTVGDFLASMIDKRLLQQLKDLRSNFEKPLIILEGEEDIYSLRKIHPNAIRGMLATITVSYAIPMVRTQNGIDTALLIKAIAKREQDTSVKEFSLRVERKPLTTREQQEFVVESFPGVGPVIAKSLLKELKSVRVIVNASEEELKRVENLGEKKAREIKELVDAIYD